MLQITIPATEQWDDARQEFIHTKEQTLRLEHSLVSLSKWESKWHKPFLNKEPKSYEETIDYIKCMTLTQNVDPNVNYNLRQDHVNQINAYIENPMTATTVNDSKNAKPNREIVTSELIYYWMIAMQIPSDYDKWHLNRLLTLIRVCGAKNESPTPMNKRDVMANNAKLNAARRKKLNSRG